MAAATRSDSRHDPRERAGNRRRTLITVIGFLLVIVAAAFAFGYQRAVLGNELEAAGHDPSQFVTGVTAAAILVAGIVIMIGFCLIMLASLLLAPARGGKMAAQIIGLVVGLALAAGAVALYVFVYPELGSAAAIVENGA